MNNNEKILIKSETYQFSKFKKIMVITGVILFVIAFGITYFGLKTKKKMIIENDKERYSSQWDKAEKNYNELYEMWAKSIEPKYPTIESFNEEASKVISGYYSKNLSVNKYYVEDGAAIVSCIISQNSKEEYVNNCVNADLSSQRYLYLDNIFIPISIGLIPFILFSALGSLICWLFGKNEITVTDKRVTGKRARGKLVELPINQISAISVGGIKGVTMASSSGVIKFSFIKNRHEIYDTVSKLLKGQQGAEKQTANNVNMSSADEIEKFKRLLDSGAITQEEYEAKKKQILGL